MKKLTLASLCCIGLGVILFLAGLICYFTDKDGYKKHMNISNITKTVASESFDTPITAINIDTDYGDITVTRDDSLSDGEVKMEWSDVDTSKFYFKVNDGVLTISYEESDINFFFNFDIGIAKTPAPKLKISVSQSLLSKLSIDDLCGNVTIQNLDCETLAVGLNFGDLFASDITAEAVDFSADCGDITAEGIECETFSADLDYGDLDIERLTAKTLSAENSCGDIDITDSTAENGEINTDYGNVKLSGCALSGFDISDSCGDITAKNCSLLGTTSVSSDFGNVELELAGDSSDYNVIYKVIDGSTLSDGNVIYIDVDTIFLDNVKIKYTGQPLDAYHSEIE